MGLASLSLAVLAVATSSNAYWLTGAKNILTTERLDPVVSPGMVSGHVHSVLGGSNFRFTTSTESLRNSECTSIPIVEDKSNYWFPHLYFQWQNGSFTSLTGGAVMYYLFSDQPGVTTAFPDDFRMISGDPTLREYNSTSFAQQAVTFLCLDFSGVSTRYNSLPPTTCPSGVRAQINFPSCWDGKNTDSPDHKSHVAFLSGGPDSGTCSDPKYPVILPRIFMEMYWGSNDFDGVRSQAMNPSQPFVFSQGDPTGYGYHADFINGWQAGILQKAVDNCHCNNFGDATCCANAGIFTLDSSQQCHITKSVDEVVEGTLPKLPGNNPVQAGAQHVPMVPDPVTPPILSPVCAYTGTIPPATCATVTTGAAATAPPAARAVLQVEPATTATTTTPTSSSVPSQTPPAMPPLFPANNGSSGGNDDGNGASSAPAASPTLPYAGASSNSTGADDDGPHPCKKCKSKNYEKACHRPHSRPLRRRFHHAF